MRPRIAGQLPLFGREYVHIGYRGHCLICRASLAAAAAWPCDDCPGWVEPVPPWMILAAADAPELEQLEAA
jgi:hypothetical protein